MTELHIAGFHDSIITLKHLYIDFDREFANQIFEKYTAKKNIKLESSVLYILEQNSKTECLKYTLMSLVRLILSIMYLPTI